MRKKLPVLLLVLIILLQAFVPAAYAASKNNAQSQTAYFCPSDATSKSAGKAPNVNTKIVNAPEVKAPNAIKSTEATNAWNNYLGSNTININPRTGLADPNRIFSADGTKSIRFGNHEMQSLGTPKGHFHYETWIYDAATDAMTITNTLQRIIP